MTKVWTLVCTVCGQTFTQQRSGGRPRKTCYDGCAAIRARRVQRGEM